MVRLRWDGNYCNRPPVNLVRNRNVLKLPANVYIFAAAMMRCARLYSNPRLRTSTCTLHANLIFHKLSCRQFIALSRCIVGPRRVRRESFLLLDRSICHDASAWINISMSLDYWTNSHLLTQIGRHFNEFAHCSTWSSVRWPARKQTVGVSLLDKDSDSERTVTNVTRILSRVKQL